MASNNDCKFDAVRNSTSSRPSLSVDTKSSPSTIKKRHTISTPALEAVDSEYLSKKDSPPRFSTLFGHHEPDLVQTPQLAPRPRRQGRGIFVPMPVFILLIAIMLFEGMGLFAYTAIGLFNNLPSQLFRHNDNLCDCNAARPPPINIAPNFVWGNGMNTPALTLPIPGIAEGPLATPTLPQVTQSSTTSLVPSSSPTTSSSSLDATAAASQLLGIFSAIDKSSSATSAAVAPSTVTTVSVITPTVPVQTITSKVVVTAAPRIITIS